MAKLYSVVTYVGKEMQCEHFMPDYFEAEATFQEHVDTYREQGYDLQRTELNPKDDDETTKVLALHIDIPKKTAIFLSEHAV